MVPGYVEYYLVLRILGQTDGFRRKQTTRSKKIEIEHPKQDPRQVIYPH